MGVLRTEENTDTFGSQVDGFFEGLLWKRTQEEIGDGSAYRTATQERRMPTFLGRALINHRKKLAALGVIATLGASAKVIEVLWPEGDTKVNRVDDTQVQSVQFQVHANVCGIDDINDCYVDKGNGLVKQEQK